MAGAPPPLEWCSRPRRLSAPEVLTWRDDPPVTAAVALLLWGLHPAGCQRDCENSQVVTEGRDTVGMGADGARVSPGDFMDEVAALMLSEDPRVTLIGAPPSARAHIRRRATATRDSVWNMQYRASLADQREGRKVGREAACATVEYRLILSPQAADSTPLIPTLVPYLRVGRVPGPMLLTDRSHVFLGGPAGTHLAGATFASEDPDIVSAATQTYLTCWEAARPWQEVLDRPTLPERTLEVALLLADGASDAEIAEALGISRRTVSAEVRAVIDWAGARSRGHAIALLVGAGR